MLEIFDWFIVRRPSTPVFTKMHGKLLSWHIDSRTPVQNGSKSLIGESVVQKILANQACELSYIM